MNSEEGLLHSLQILVSYLKWQNSGEIWIISFLLRLTIRHMVWDWRSQGARDGQLQDSCVGEGFGWMK